MTLLFNGAEWDIETIGKAWEVIDSIGQELGLDYYPPHLEIITAEQMLEGYSSHAMPLMYQHWSFGKSFVKNEDAYKQGKMGLAYEVVINTNPMLTYLIENNTMTMQTLVICHAVCVDKETEYLTPTGWKKISEYDNGLVGQYTSSGVVEFVRPSRYIKKTTDKFYHINARGVDQAVSPGHNLVYKTPEGLLKKQSIEEFIKTHVSKTRGHNGAFITHFTCVGRGIPLTDDELRLEVAIKADGSLCPKKNTGHFNCVNHQRIRFHLKKPRKIERLKCLLHKLGIEYTEAPTYGGRLCIHFNYKLTIEKRYTSDWYKATPHQQAIIAEECLKWDGHEESRKFSSNHKEDVDYIQFIFAAQGFGTNITKDNRTFNVRAGSYNERSISKSRGGTKNIIKVLPGGEAYCFTVPSGMFITRRNGHIAVTGNCGHGSFFKNNYLFKEWTDAEYILDYLNFAKNYIKECETQYGADQVEGLLDACHTIQYYGVDKYKRPSTLKKELAEQRAEKWQQYLDESFNELHTTVPGYKKQEIPVVTKERQFPEENLLYFIEKHSPSLEPWQREVVRIVRKISQYFYPQMQTKMMNEGWASFVHYEMMEILRERGYISEGSYMEFLCDHCNVIKQPDFNSHYYNGINPYALGISIFQDLKRVITNPTEEDKQWFPDIAGTGDYWTTLKDIVANYKDESFVLQFLSPKVIRDKKLFVLRNNEEEDHYYIDATHDEEDVYEVRDVLSKQYQLATSLPQIEITGVDWDDTRALELVHTVYDGKILDYKTAKQTLLHIKYLWGFDVLIEYKDPDGNIVERTTTDD